MDSNKVNQCVEACCENGCEAVRATISRIELGENIEQVYGLDAQEAATVLRELKVIMAVYDERK